MTFIDSKTHRKNKLIHCFLKSYGFSLRNFCSIFLLVFILSESFLEGSPDRTTDKVSSASEDDEEQDPFIDDFYHTVLTTISCSEVEGLNPEQIEAMRPDLFRYWTEVVETGLILDEGSDEKFRACFVTLQGIIEHVLAHELGKGITSLIAVIHTPQPATPVCTKGEVSSELVDPAVVEDPLRASTIKSRAATIRFFLEQGGNLYVVYPKGGKELRTAEQQKIYEEELQRYPTRLFDCELTRGPFSVAESDLIGAFYLFEQGDRQYAFAIQVTQANDIRKQGRYALWFGPLTHPEIRDRIEMINREVLVHTKRNFPILKIVNESSS